MALYRLPLEPEFGSTWTCSGNWDVGGAHGPGDPGDHADGQCYAFDLGHKTGGKILAARAGLVIDMLNDVPDEKRTRRARAPATMCGSDSPRRRSPHTATCAATRCA